MKNDTFVWKTSKCFENLNFPNLFQRISFNFELFVWAKSYFMTYTCIYHVAYQ